MAHFQELARYFSAAGATASGDDGSSMTMLFTDKGSLISKRWTGEEYGSEEFIAKSVRPGSAASLITTPAGKRIVAISDSNVLRVLRYDDEEEEWTDEEIPRFTVHPKGQVVAFAAGETALSIIFQDASGKLVLLDGVYEPVRLPADPVAGTALNIAYLDDIVHIYYLAQDNTLHDLVRGADGAWQDSVFADIPASDVAEKVLVANDPDTGVLSAMVLANGNKILVASAKSSADPKTSVLGHVENGKFVAGTSQECCGYYRCYYPCYNPCGGGWGGNTNININGNGNTVNVWR